jgi:hypothetical protein
MYSWQYAYPNLEGFQLVPSDINVTHNS